MSRISPDNSPNALPVRSRTQWVGQDWRIILFGFVLMFCSSPGQTYFIALFGGEIRTDLGLTHGEFGALYSAATLCSAFLLLWSGKLLDQTRLKVFMLCVVAGLTMASLLMSYATSVLTLFLAILMLRHFGQGLMSMTSTTTMMRYVPLHKAKAGAFSHMGYSAAEATLPSIIVACLLVFAWRDVWRWLALILVMIVPLLLSYLLATHQRAKRQSAQSRPETPTELSWQDAHAVPAPVQWSRAQVVRDPLFYAILLGLTCQSLLYTGYMFHQVHLVAAKGWSLPMWASLYLVFSVTALTMSIVVGALVDRLGALRVIPWINLPMMLGLLLLASSSSWFTAAVFMVCMAISTAGQAANTAPFYSERYGNQNLGAIKSLGSFYMVLMTAVSPVILGALIDAGISMDALALGGVAYAVLGSSIAAYGCRAALGSPNPRA